MVLTFFIIMFVLMMNVLWRYICLLYTSTATAAAAGASVRKDLVNVLTIVTGMVSSEISSTMPMMRIESTIADIPISFPSS